jgi:uncharacterized protein (DUF305 family)
MLSAPFHPEIVALCRQIVENQQREIAQREAFLARH